jgi:hypothetical protein
MDTMIWRVACFARCLLLVAVLFCCLFDRRRQSEVDRGENFTPRRVRTPGWFLFFSSQILYIYYHGIFGTERTLRILRRYGDFTTDVQGPHERTVPPPGRTQPTCLLSVVKE